MKAVPMDSHHQHNQQQSRCQGEGKHDCSMGQSQRLHQLSKRLLPAVLLVLSLTFIAGISLLGWAAQTTAASDSLLRKRQNAGAGTGNDSSSDGDTGTFVNDHLYLYVSFNLQTP